jgi:hypothetical protein
MPFKLGHKRMQLPSRSKRRAGYVIILAFSLFASGLLIIHMKGPGGVTGGIKSGGAFFFAWTLLILGVTAIFSVVLSVRGLWSLRRREGQTIG